MEIATNAVLAAMLFQASQFVKELDIPLATPLERSNVVAFRAYPIWTPGEPDLNCYLAYQGGYEFRFGHGTFSGFNTRYSYTQLQNPDAAEQMIGEVRYSEADCLVKTRTIFTNLGYDTIAFLTAAPEVKGPFRVRTGMVPRFIFRWPKNPGSRASDAEIEVNAIGLTIEDFYLGNPAFWRKSWPITFGSTNTLNQALGRAPPSVPKKTDLEVQGVSREYAFAFLTAILPHISQFCSKLGPPFPAKVAQEDINMGESEITMKLGHPSASLRLKSGYLVVFASGHVWAVHAPDAYYTSPWWREEVKQSKEYLEPIHFSEQQVTEKVRRVLVDQLHLDEKALFLDTQPAFGLKPNPSATNGIRRYVVQWQQPLDEAGRVERQRTQRLAEVSVSAEVDAVSGDIKTLNFLHQSLFRTDPKVDVPLSPANAQPKSP